MNMFLLMVQFSQIFHFSRSEVSLLYSKAKLKKKVLGLKLLQAPLSFLCSPTLDQSIKDQSAQSQASNVNHGKLLIVIPRAFGKACKRNRFRRQVKAIFYENKLHQHMVASILIVYRQAQDFTLEQLKDFLLTNIPPEPDAS